MTEPLGTIVMDEIIAPVVRVELHAGAFIVVARVSGPVDKHRTALHDCVVHGSDGSVVIRGKFEVGWAKVREDDVIEFSFSATPKDHLALVDGES